MQARQNTLQLLRAEVRGIQVQNMNQLLKLNPYNQRDKAYVQSSTLLFFLNQVQACENVLSCC